MHLRRLHLKRLHLHLKAEKDILQEYTSVASCDSRPSVHSGMGEAKRLKTDLFRIVEDLYARMESLVGENQSLMQENEVCKSAGDVFAETEMGFL